MVWYEILPCLALLDLTLSATAGHALIAAVVGSWYRTGGGGFALLCLGTLRVSCCFIPSFFSSFLSFVLFCFGFWQGGRFVVCSLMDGWTCIHNQI